MTKLIKYFCITLLFLSFNLSCAENKNKMKIAISKASGSSSYLNYPNWLKSIDNEIEIVDFNVMSYDSALIALETCDALLLSGGPDAHPGRFGKPNDTATCTIDLKRDTIEFKALEIALNRKMPILGICRGEQLINIHLGGDLIIDIPSDSNVNKLKLKVSHQDKVSKKDETHKVRVTESSLLYKITNVISGEVNSNHHQAVGKIANDLYVSSRTEDGLIESIEWSNPKDKSWLLVVQWHPERMDKNNPLSTPIAQEFLKAAKTFKSGKK